MLRKQKYVQEEYICLLAIRNMQVHVNIQMKGISYTSNDPIEPRVEWRPSH